MIDRADIVVGLAWGDEAKGKVTNQLASREVGGKKYYDFVARWNGGSNAGHTIYVGDNCYKTHIIPCGVFHGIKSIIGPNCVLHPESFYKELDMISSAGFDTSLVKVSPNTHIVTDNHIDEDKRTLSKKLGTTSRGIAPAYSAKAARVGLLAKDVLEYDHIWDGNIHGNILCEGAQGIWLDINKGIYPYVTSSETLPYSACSIGFPTQVIDRVYGAAKIYDTRSGEDPLFPSTLLNDPILKSIADVGEEYGVTTGRRRKVNWLDLNRLISAINISGSTDVIINKCDILQEVGVYKLFYNEELLDFSGIEDITKFVEERIRVMCRFVSVVTFSYSPLFV
jgi:adenylosuccinate synthase